MIKFSILKAYCLQQQKRKALHKLRSNFLKCTVSKVCKKRCFKSPTNLGTIILVDTGSKIDTWWKRNLLTDYTPLLILLTLFRIFLLTDLRARSSSFVSGTSVGIDIPSRANSNFSSSVRTSLWCCSKRKINSFFLQLSAHTAVLLQKSLKSYTNV